MTKAVVRSLLVAIATLSLVGGVRATDRLLELKWAQLMPPAQPVSPSKPKTFFSGSTPSTADGASGCR